MLHLMRQSISFSTTASLLTPSAAPVTTVARVADYANELGSFNRPRDTWFPASVVDTAVALLTGEVGLLPRDAAPMVGAGAGDTFAAEDLARADGTAYIAAPVRNGGTGATAVVRATLHGFSPRQLKLISERVNGKPYVPAPDAAPVATVEAVPAAPVEPVTVLTFLVGKALITGPGFQGGVRRNADRPRLFDVFRFGGDAPDGHVVIGTATTYAKAGALLAKHFGQPDLPVVVERAASGQVPARAAA